MSTNLGFSAVNVNRIFTHLPNLWVHSRKVDFAERLRAEIEARGIKQSWLALEAGIPEETLSRILTRSTKNPGLVTASRIAAALRVSVGYLLGEVDPRLSPAILGLVEILEAVPPGDRRRLIEHTGWVAQRITQQATDNDDQATLPLTARARTPKNALAQKDVGNKGGRDKGKEEKKEDKPTGHIKPK